MVFSSLVFLCVFLPIVLVMYFACPKQFRNFVLLIASLIFYAWGEPRYILLMLFSTIFDYVNGRLLDYFDQPGKEKSRKRILILSIVGNLGILLFFKYTDLFIKSWNQATASNIGLLKVALPIGISFYTFQTMSYTIDVYRHKVKVQKNIIAFGMYICMFPQLIAGPIVRYETIENQMLHREVNAEKWVHGMQRFIIGLGKKVILANQIGVLWDTLSAQSPEQISVVGAWLGAIAYTFQIYFDFSGYSDMAIGLGELFGFDFPENFRYPYKSKNITEFWRRWHMTLGTWFREYVYIPLGGNRKGIQRQVLNLFVVWFLTGFWHGASWNFAIWGIYFFIILLIEKLILLKEMKKWPQIFQHLYSKFLIILGWVIFALSDFSQMRRYIGAMFGMTAQVINSDTIYYLKNYALLLCLMCLASTELFQRAYRKYRRHIRHIEPEFVSQKGKQTEFLLYSFYTIFILVISLAILVRSSYNPFLYFRF